METVRSKTLLQTSRLTKNFGRDRGVFGLSIKVQQGEIVGFVGPNGAGKSTTINMVTGLIRPDKGTYKLLGKPANHTTTHQFMPSIGVLYSEPTLDDSVSARTLFVRNQRLMGQDYTAAWQRLSGELGLDTGKKLGKLSLGNKKKVGIVNALMHSPRLLVMDEPTSGLDPLVRATLLRLLEEFAAGGGAVLLSSHDLTEVQQICHRVVMIKQGKLVLDEPTEQLLARTTRRFRLHRPPAAAIEALARLELSPVHQGGGELAVEATDYTAVIKALAGSGFYDYFIEQPSLAETFAKEYC